MNNNYWLMRKLFLIFLVTIFSSLANADKPDAPIPPQLLKADDIQGQKAPDVLLNKINTLIQRTENNYTHAKIILAQGEKIILNYDYQYGWRASDVVQQTLIYKKKNLNWTLTDTINFSTEARSIIGDLTGDGVSELLVFDKSGFRNTIMSEEIVMQYDTTKEKYVKTGLIARTEATVGECNDMKNRYENISIEKSKSSPIVSITLKNTKVSKTDCEETPVFTSKREYEWSAKQKKFISVSVASSLLRWVRTLISL